MDSDFHRASNKTKKFQKMFRKVFNICGGGDFKLYSERKQSLNYTRTYVIKRITNTRKFFGYARAIKLLINESVFFIQLVSENVNNIM